MTNYRELLSQVKGEIDEIDAQAAAPSIGDGTVFLDVRELHEWDEGHIPGAIHVPRGSLESRIENAVPDHDGRILGQPDGGHRDARPDRAGLRRGIGLHGCGVAFGQVQAVPHAPEPLAKIGVLVQQVVDRGPEVLGQAG